MTTKIKKRDIFFIMIRSFFINTLWNFRKFQNVGFLYAILPAIKRLYPKGVKRALAMKRHIKYFNTHPYLSASIIGVVVNMEEKRVALNKDNSTSEIEQLKSNMMGPFAALGDSFFWGAWRPFLVVVAIAFISTTSNISLMIFSIIFFLVFFNIPHLFIRIAGLVEGYRKGFEVIDEIKRLDIHGLVEKIKIIAIIFIACFIAIVFPFEKIDIMGFSIFANFLLIGITFLYAIFLNLRVSATVLFAITLIFCIVLSYMGVTIDGTIKFFGLTS